MVAGKGAVTAAYVKSVRMACHGRRRRRRQSHQLGAGIEVEAWASVGLTRTRIFSILRSASGRKQFCGGWFLW